MFEGSPVAMVNRIRNQHALVHPLTPLLQLMPLQMEKNPMAYWTWDAMNGHGYQVPTNPIPTTQRMAEKTKRPDLWVPHEGADMVQMPCKS